MVKLSASRIKCLKDCSWLYYSKYIEKIPDSGNDGSKRGTIIHAILELLSKDKHKKKAESILENSVIIDCVDRYLKVYAKKLGILNDENMDRLRSMLFVGLRHDFFRKADEVREEYKFDLVINKNGKSFIIIGFIDKFYIDHKEKKSLIRDFKTSKAKYSGEDLDFNLQEMMYLLAASKILEGYLNELEFIFLRFPDNPVVKSQSPPKLFLDAFEDYLLGVSEHLENFDENKAMTDFAKNKPFPKDGSFSGPLLCGSKNPERWQCSARNPIEYYHVYKDGKFIESVFNLPEERGNLEYRKRQYLGCPMFHPENYYEDNDW